MVATDVSIFSLTVCSEIKMECSPPTASACCPPNIAFPDLSEIQGRRNIHAAILPLISRRGEGVRPACTETHGPRIGHGYRRMQHWSAAPPDPPWGSKKRVIRQQRSPVSLEGSQVPVHGGEARAMLGTAISARLSKNKHRHSPLTLPTQGVVRHNPRPDRRHM